MSRSRLIVNASVAMPPRQGACQDRASVHCSSVVMAQKRGMLSNSRWRRVLVRRLPNKRLKLAARVDYEMNRSSARRSLSAIR